MNLPILNYHGLESRPEEYEWLDEERPYVLSLLRFSSQMEELLRRSYRTLGLADLKEWQSGKGKEKPVMITFDDGLKSHGDHAAVLLQKKNMKAIFFIPVSLVGQKGHMGWDELRLLVRHGFDIGSHGMNHVALTGLSEREVKEELVKSKKTLEDKVGVPIKSFSIPRGYFTDEMRVLARDAGYEFLFTSSFDVNLPGSDLYALKRMVVKRETSDKQFVDCIEGNLGFRKHWEQAKEKMRASVPPAFYDALAATKRKVRG